GREAYEGWLHLPIVIPEVCMGVALLAFFALLDLPLGLFTITASHIAFSVPFVAVVVRARMQGFDPALEEASRDLGASDWQIFRRITLPLFIPAILGGALFAFTLSFTELIRSIFVVSPNTLPLQVLAEVTVWGVSPYIFAIGSLIVIISLALLLLAGFLLRGVFEKLQI
ncbi:MAG: ABC transporter permease subunit, partial [Candidatus Caldarchaeum sp.]